MPEESPPAPLVPPALPIQRLYVRLYLAALFVYIVFWGLMNYTTAPDTAVYLEMGRGVFSQGVFGLPDSNGIHHPGAFRMPFFPVLLGLLDLALRDGELVAFTFSILQLFFAPVLACVAFYFGDRLNRWCAYGAFLFVLGSMNVLQCSITVLTDTLFAAASSVSFVIVWQAVDRLSVRRAAVAGVAIGVACLVRPIMKLYPLLVFFFYPLLRNRQPRQILLASGIMVATFAAVLAPWAIRNVVHYGRPALETNQGMNLLWSNLNLVQKPAGEDQEFRELRLWLIEENVKPKDLTLFHGHDYWVKHDLAVSDELQALAVYTLRRAPLGLARNWAENVINMTTSLNHYDVAYEQALSRPTYARMVQSWLWQPETFARRFYHAQCELARLMRWSYGWVAWIGLALIVLRNWRLGIFIAFNLAYFVGLTAVVAGYDRYRLNLECFYGVMVAACLVLPVLKVKTLTQRRKSAKKS